LVIALWGHSSRRSRLVFIERRTAELKGDGDSAPPPRESVAPAALVRAAPTPEDDDAGKIAITLLLDTRVLARVDGISRTTWLQVSADKWLEGRP
jgi:hypothetical protein